MTTPVARGRARIACVLLAAGGSSRLGRPKQLVRRGPRPLLLHALDAARGAPFPDEDVVVVLGAEALRLRALLRRHAPRVRIAANARWATGHAGSLHRLVAAWRRRPAFPAAAHYSGRAGVPAVLPRRAWRSLRALDGDAGARALLRGAGAITRVAMPEAELDVDTPADIARL